MDGRETEYLALKDSNGCVKETERQPYNVVLQNLETDIQTYRQTI